MNVLHGLSPWCLALSLVVSLTTESRAQQYDLFEVNDEEVFWRNTYKYHGSADSIRREVVQMLKSKFFTFNVIRNETGYNGEIRHYHVDCRRYGRIYFNTPRIYWEGEWTGKFIVDVNDHQYRVTVYALYVETPKRPGRYERTDLVTRGRYYNLVLRKHKHTFKKSELANMALMSLSLKDNFDISNTTLPPAH